MASGAVGDTPVRRRMPRWMRGVVCAVLACVTCCVCPAVASDMTPGFTTLGVWLPEREARLDINVWYPSVRRPGDVTYGYWQMQVARNGKAQEGHYPLILLSHDSAGTRFSYHATAGYLATLGFVVAAPTHLRDNMDNMPEMFTVEQLEHRVHELRVTLDVLLRDADMRQRIDKARVGVLGFGVGGTAALLIGGALMAPDGWADYCASAPAGDAYCTLWVKARMDKMVRRLPLPYSLADPRVKAVCAAAPAFGMLFTRESLRYVYPPVKMFVAQNDGGMSPPWQVERLRSLLPSVPYVVQLEDVDAPALAACPYALQRQLPDVCGLSTPLARRKAVDTLNNEAGHFFLQVLGDAQSTPVIQDPPVFQLPPTPEPEEMTRRAGEEASTKPAPARRQRR